MFATIKVLVASLLVGISSFFGGKVMPNTTPIPAAINFIDDYKLFGMVNDLRNSKKLKAVSTDYDVCQVGQKILDNAFWQSNIQLKDYKNVCPSCSSLSVAESQSQYNLESMLTSWQANTTTLNTLQGNYKYGCVKVNNDKVVLVMASKNVIAPAITTNNIVNTDPLVNCNINVNCGGGTKSMKSSECNQSTCCQIGSKWYFYFSKTKCTADQAANTPSTSTNYNYTYTPPTYYPCTLYYPALNLYQTYNSLYKTKADCDAAQASIGQGTQPIQYTAPVQQLPQITKSQCQASVNDKWRSQMMSQGCAYPCPDSGDCGSTGTCSFMWQQVQKEMNNCNQYP